ncbi:cysteine-rich receptor-like protein kinase 10 isoform X2 [Vicia villosa]|uniref:cysteine-rich receptor-like protein kinase 10 isoform X2 n=1 Tax=Vicia villosa TaxID=3911 RepID=UPI00273B6A76|nr:cysteine-rich receptor-like protein kinase 10 isoform X2 [Vicia villosa]
MLSSRCLLFLLLPLFFTLHTQANDQIIFRYSECNNDLGNFTDGSTYQNNLAAVLKIIYSNREIDYGFYNFSYGDEPDKVNAIGFCRGDINPNDCRDCLKTSAVLLTDRCGIQKEAIGYYDICTLRYSNDSIFGVMDTDTAKYYNIESKTVVDDAFNQTISGLLDELKSAAAEGDSRKKFGEKSVKVNELNTNNETIYGLVQCTPDLTKQNCTRCLDSAYGDLSRWCPEMKGCLYLGPSCSVRYDIVQFYESIVNNTESPAPQPSSQAISPKPSSSVNSTTTTTGKKRKLRTAIAIVLSCVVAGMLVVGGCIYCKRRGPKPEYRAEIEVQETYEDEDEDEVRAGNDLKVGDLLQFDFETIKLATSNFSDENALGQGGFGTVYKGTLDGLDVAIKRLANNSKQGETEFKNEVLLTGKLQHRNLVKLLGFCLQRGERLLIYEFVPNKSLDYIIFDPIKRGNLNWERRFKIIKDIARGLLYLHEDSRLQIVHRDLKTSNILLDNEMNPKITDFGIAKLFAPNQTHGMTSTVIGTYGYMAPEYIKHGEFSIKSDVFSFGVIILEIVCGRRNTKFRDGENIKDLLDNAWENWKTGTSLDIVDPMLDQSFNKNEKMRCIHVGLLCVQEDVDVRPTMSSVLLMLSSTSFPLPEPSEPPFLMQPKRALSISLSDQYSGPTRSSDSGSGSQFTQGSTTKSSVTDQ